MNDSPAAREARSLATWADQTASWTVEQALIIQGIAAPTFAEGARAAWVSGAFRAAGLQDISTDDVLNVYGCLRGTGEMRRTLLVTAHTDTVFHATTDLTTRTAGDTIYGPGLGDNSIGVAALLALAHWLGDQPDRLVDVWFVATSREEGLGDLGGIKAAYARLGPQAGAVLNLEGLALGHLYHGGIAVRRLKLTATTGGGHSWFHYGQPSALHALIELCDDLLRLSPPTLPRTTFNIGLIEGGDAINAIASRAAAWLDLRSETSKALARFEGRVMDRVANAAQEGVKLEVEVVGDRPAGQIPITHPLVHLGIEALAAVGLKASLESGSTDANVPLAAGCPAITLGVTRGGNAHRTDEFIEIGPVSAGLHHLALALTSAMAYVATL